MDRCFSGIYRWHDSSTKDNEGVRGLLLLLAYYKEPLLRSNCIFRITGKWSLTAKHYIKRTREAYSYWISRFIREHKDKNLKTRFACFGRARAAPYWSFGHSAHFARSCFTVGYSEANRLPHVPPLICNASTGIRLQYPHHPRTSRSQRCFNHYGLHPRPQPRRSRRSKPYRPNVICLYPI